MAKKIIGQFVLKRDAKPVMAANGPAQWISTPGSTGLKQIVSLIATFQPGTAHDFHIHPGQEEIIYVLRGTIEQWLEGEKCIMKAGDSIVIGADVPHATFNTSKKNADIFVVLSPAKGRSGYKAVDVSKKLPWRDVRKTVSAKTVKSR
jgi:quercetin dioxygenase-like cupin family protein